MTPLIDTQLEIGTPERLAFRARIAGPARRTISYLLDLLVRFFIVLVLGIAALVVFGSAGLGGVGMGMFLLGWFVLDWGYFFACEMLTGGRSPGKMALRLRVVRPNGLPITWRESLLRNLARAVDLVAMPPSTGILFLGSIVMAFDRQFRRAGDLLADTIVVIEEPTRVGGKTALDAKEDIMAELPMTLPLDRTEMEALELFVHRPHMSQARREELAEIVADVFAKRLHVTRPRSATDFLASIWARAQDPHRRLRGAQ